ncbi:hypothetical protein MTR67_018944 [Solanum verrucosum]|uniref:Uncharacterized protein n=1 Tax=Solanum verrucosum TaxID=315347 RepID=A0AAF0QKL0_SOLVR|nr:hypothetical protein MTR67_018944 [Solanum verrucosum]
MANVQNLELQIKKSTLELQIVDANIRPDSSPLVTTGTQVNNLFQSWLEYVHSNWNDNFNNNNNIKHIIQHNDYSSVQSDAIAPNVNGFINFMEVSSNGHDNFHNNNTNNHIIQQTDHSSAQSDVKAANVDGFNSFMEENTMGNNEYHVENTLENDAWEWDDVFLNEALNGKEFRNLD